MKEIQSAGGPLIGLDRDHLQLWTGIHGKRFIGDASPFNSDYEAAGSLTNGRAYAPCSISKIEGSIVSAILISSSNDTAVIDHAPDSVYAVQVEYCDPEWGFHLLCRADFDRANFDPQQDVAFSCKSCTYVLFDAAYAGRDVVDDCLTFDLDEGAYVLSTAIYEPDDRTGLILCKITKARDISSACVT